MLGGSLTLLRDVFVFSVSAFCLILVGCHPGSSDADRRMHERREATRSACSSAKLVVTSGIVDATGVASMATASLAEERARELDAFHRELEASFLEARTALQPQLSSDEPISPNDLVGRALLEARITAFTHEARALAQWMPEEWSRSEGGWFHSTCIVLSSLQQLLSSDEPDIAALLRSTEQFNAWASEATRVARLLATEPTPLLNNANATALGSCNRTEEADRR